MLDTFRKHSNSSLIYLIFGALIFVFIVSFGEGSKGFETGSITGSTEFAAKVNDKTISIIEFRKQYKRQLDSIEQRTGQAVSDDMAMKFHLKERALETLVNTQLLVQAAKSRGLRVGDVELAKEIQSIPAFQKDGTFDTDTYKKVLSYQGIDMSEFEGQERQALLAQKMATLVASSAAVSPDEVRAAFDKQHDQANITFVRFAPSQFMGQVKAAPSADEVAKFVTAHTEAIQSFYKTNGYRYHKPQRYQARDILIKAPAGASATDDAAAKAKADKAHAELVSGKSFAEVATTYSDDTATKGKGGEMGVIVPAVLGKALGEAVAKLKAGEYTAPIHTRFGYQIIQVEKVVPPEDKTLDQVKNDIALELIKSDAAKTMAHDQAEAALKDAQAGKTLDALYPPDANASILGATKPAAQETGMFSIGEYVPKLGEAPEVAQAAFQLTSEKPLGPKVFQVANTFVVISLKAREKPTDADFAKDQDEIREALVSSKKNDLLEAFVKELRAAGHVEENRAVTLPDDATRAS